MSSDDVFNGFDRLDSSVTDNPTDVLDFLNSSDNENELTDPPKELENSIIEKTSEDESVNEDAPSLTLSITNVVVMASMRCHLRLKEIARSSVDVEYKALQNHVIMRLRSPYTVATIWSSGKIWCTGANSLAKAKVGARRIARRIAKCGFPCRFSKYKVVNIMATCHLPFRVRLEQLVRERPMMMSYEPELAPGLTFKTEPNSSTSLKLFSTGRIVIMGSSLETISALVEDLETISALVEELVPLAALHQTDEPVSDSDVEEEQQKAELRAAARRMVFVPEGLPPDELGFVEDEEEDDPDVDEFASDSDESSLNAPTRYRAPPVFSTDDSTDSGASIDSGGMSTRPKRRRKRRAVVHSGTPTTGSRSLQNYSSGPPLHLMTAREAASLAFAKRASGDIAGARGLVAAAAEVRRQHELGELSLSASSAVQSTELLPASTVYSDPTWSRKAVASGSTKRACVVTYSGTEDSSAEAAETVIPSQQPQSGMCTLPGVTSLMMTPVATLSPAAVTTTVPQSSCISVATFIPQQYVVTQTVSPGLGQPIQTHTSAVLPYSTPSVVSHSQPQAIRVAAPNAPVVSTMPLTFTNPSGSNISPAIYPIRLSGPVQQAIIPSVGPKIMSTSPNVPITTQYMNVNPLLNAQTYQFYQPNMLISSPAMFPLNGPSVQPGTATIFSGGNGGVFLSGMPTCLGSVVIQHPVAQNTTQFYQTFVGQTHTRLP
ncbi:Transcription initiation factor TFIID TATA-box-binding protein [Fasciola hepatica]|uniref:Transcription initiation factor TFIID TATA-box-binding protein n=1 Tax=Fasciola hepatica TaxID=6192 RepID=A0A4E0RZM5_FASHE|nr:Transcription initiation factor TFIID TATA-box-binding protein [Fasciola hepatica]